MQMVVVKHQSYSVLGDDMRQSPGQLLAERRDTDSPELQQPLNMQLHQRFLQRTKSYFQQERSSLTGGYRQAKVAASRLGSANAGR